MYRGEVVAVGKLHGKLPNHIVIVVGKWKAKSWLNRSARTVTFYFTNKRFTGRVEGDRGEQLLGRLVVVCIIATP